MLIMSTGRPDSDAPPHPNLWTDFDVASNVSVSTSPNGVDVHNLVSIWFCARLKSHCLVWSCKFLVDNYELSFLYHAYSLGHSFEAISTLNGSNDIFETIYAFQESHLGRQNSFNNPGAWTVVFYPNVSYYGYYWTDNIAKSPHRSKTTDGHNLNKKLCYCRGNPRGTCQ